MTTPAEIQLAILNGPALAPPAGVVSQFVNPPNLNTEGYTVVAVSLFFALVAFGMRLYTKMVLLRKLENEDYCLLLGVALFIVYSSICLKTMVLGAGTHQWDLQVKSMNPLLYYINAGENTYDWCVAFIKASILLQYLRIFNDQTTKVTLIYIGSWATLGLFVSFYMVVFFMTVFACNPREKIWSPLLTTGSCLDTEKTNIVSGIFNVVSDIMLVLLPQYEIWKLQMSLLKKMKVATVFLVALWACATSAVRLYYAIETSRSSDRTYFIFFEGATGVAEFAIGIICCCLPILPRFFQAALHPNHSSTNRLVPGSSRPDTAPNGPRSPRIHGTYATLNDAELRNLNGMGKDDGSDVGVVSERKLSGFICRTSEVTVESVPAEELERDLERGSETSKNWPL